LQFGCVQHAFMTSSRRPAWPHHPDESEELDLSDEDPRASHRGLSPNPLPELARLLNQLLRRVADWGANHGR